MVTDDKVFKPESFFSKVFSSTKLPETIQMTRKDERIAAVL
jgi:hypothetical protein